LREVAELPEEELPTRAPRSDGPPTARAWADRDPVAARRLQHAREAMAALAEEHSMPAEQLLTPDSMRRTLWTPPRTRDPEALAAAVAEQLCGYGARPWQVELTTPLLVAAILHGDEPVPEPEAPQPDTEA
ncbi:MAG: ribonuclease D, partial [Actinobacteria bacterium]|nr:ribonuclease D [Actinomycetota bacterium]MBU2111656.1 ribonuclease D [Actinomycetota bacterium]